MIKNIKISNYRHFNNIEINFEVKSKIIPNRVGLDTTIKLGKYKLLKQIGIIGANSSGKTSTLEAIKLVTNILNVNKGSNFFNNELNDLFLYNRQLISQKKQRNQNLSTINKDFDQDIKNSINFEYSENVNDLWKNEIFANLAFNFNKNIIIEIKLINKEGLEKKIIAELMCDFPKAKIIIDSNIFIINYNEDIYNNKNNDNQKIIKKLKDIGFPIMAISSNNRYFHASIPLNKEYKEDFLKWMRLADPNIRDIITRDNGEHYIVENFLTFSGENKRFHHLSLGTKIWLNWFFLINFKNEFILFDEIDSSLHIKLIRFFLRKLSEKNIQVVFTTHNPLVFGKTFRNDAIYFIDYNDNKLKRLIDYKKIDKDKNIQKMILEEEIGIHPDLTIIYDELV